MQNQCEEDYSFHWDPPVTAMYFFVPEGQDPSDRFTEAALKGLVLSSATKGTSYIFGRPEEQLIVSETPPQA